MKKMSPAIKLFAVAIGLFISGANHSFGQISDETNRLNTLQSAIQNVLLETNTPAVGIALVTKDTSILIAAFGKANIKDNIIANENTLFRIASISKMFVALAILKLQEEGKVNLQDKIHDVVPEIEFTSKWENTNPVRIVHLLEHTTGWDDYHLAEQVSAPITLRQALDLHPDSRTSRWVPGTRMAYSNSGAGVAGYIIEKISGQPYEDYVKENLFHPLKMEHTTFFNDDKYEKQSATLYDENIQPLAYRHVIQRPAGSINSSARDMARLVRFFLNRGRIDSLQLINETSVLRMEIPKSTPAATAGLQLGYGLANMTTLYNRFVYHGHRGGLEGAASELAYLPEHGIGHVFFINAGNLNAFLRISTLLLNFETETIKPDSVPRHPGITLAFKFRTGYYVPINPRIQGGYFLDRLIDIYRFEANDSCIVKSWIFPGSKSVFYPLSDSTFALEPGGRIMMVKARDPLAGDVLYTDSVVYDRIPAFLVFGQIAIAMLWPIFMATGFLTCLVAIIRYRNSGNRHILRVVTYPTIASMLFISSAWLLMFSRKNYNAMLAEPGILAITLMILSTLFVLSALGSLAVIFRSRKEAKNKLILLQMTVLSSLHVLVAVYLLSYGVIPLMTWS
jgi:CubicO group peptidase (beta-lactamase class C family)